MQELPSHKEIQVARPRITLVWQTLTTMDDFNSHEYQDPHMAYTENKTEVRGSWTLGPFVLILWFFKARPLTESLKTTPFLMAPNVDKNYDILRSISTPPVLHQSIHICRPVVFQSIMSNCTGIILLNTTKKVTNNPDGMDHSQWTKGRHVQSPVGTFRLYTQYGHFDFTSLEFEPHL